MKRKIDPELWLFRVFMAIFLTCVTIYICDKLRDIESDSIIRDDTVVNPILCVWEVKE